RITSHCFTMRLTRDSLILHMSKLENISWRDNGPTDHRVTKNSMRIIADHDLLRIDLETAKADLVRPRTALATSSGLPIEPVNILGGPVARLITFHAKENYAVDFYTLPTVQESTIEAESNALATKSAVINVNNCPKILRDLLGDSMDKSRGGLMAVYHKLTRGHGPDS
ncbi:MAG TPA: hypothetical protein VE177_07440, partial [Candidatus Binatus sp.]|nr:hypothetical protein [Candidatus Binatus sp.]